MFSTRVVTVGSSTLQFREEQLTGLRCRISPDRTRRNLDDPVPCTDNKAGCPFCPPEIFDATPVFPGGNRILVGESVTFPNLYPFATYHTVTVITSEHAVNRFSRRQLLDAFHAQYQSLEGQEGYASINWNYLPSAGASLSHPHLQGMVDPVPTRIAGLYMNATEKYYTRHGHLYQEDWILHERETPRFLFGEEICWMAHAVPLGEREVRAHLPVTTLEEFESYIDLFVDGVMEIIGIYRQLGTHAFNLAMFFSNNSRKPGFKATCSMISRINPNTQSLSDSAFMERLHLEPVILTLPEELGTWYRNQK